jgi:hypothetical protein
VIPDGHGAFANPTCAAFIPFMTVSFRKDGLFDRERQSIGDETVAIRECVDRIKKHGLNNLTPTRPVMICRTTFLIAIFFLVSSVSHADDGRGLRRGGNANDVSISGISSGAAMAVQYAVAHSASVVGVGSIAGPGWGCAGGSVSHAINDCMCGRHPVQAQTDLAHSFADNNPPAIDPLNAGKPKALQRAYVFQSVADRVVVAQSGKASIDFLTAFIGTVPVVDRGNSGDDSDHAGHGIISPDGTDACRADGNEATYVRHCGAEDNAGKLFHALYGANSAYDPSKRVSAIPESEVWTFDQQRIIDAVKDKAGEIAPDSFFWIFPVKSSRRENLDLAQTGYLYVPPSCRQSGSNCRVHIALHGCKQDAKNFATTAGYNNWAEYYKVIVVYPAIEQHTSQAAEVCQVGPIPRSVDDILIEPNDNSCWDWWGYLDIGWPEGSRYLTKGAPQMQVIERIIAEVTKPIP